MALGTTGGRNALSVTVWEATATSLRVAVDATVLAVVGVLGIVAPDGRAYTGTGNDGRVVVLDYGSTTAELAARPWTDWVRTYRHHERGGAPLGDRASVEDAEAPAVGGVGDDHLSGDGGQRRAGVAGVDGHDLDDGQPRVGRRHAQERARW